jgi:hypothetical protein
MLTVGSCNGRRQLDPVKHSVSVARTILSLASVATLMGRRVEFYVAKERYEQLRRTARACDDAAASSARRICVEFYSDG